MQCEDCNIHSPYLSSPTKGSKKILGSDEELQTLVDSYPYIHMLYELHISERCTCEQIRKLLFGE